MKRIFISSIQNGYEAVREAAKRGVESLGFIPVMAETTPAAARPSRDALLDQLRGCDAVVLLIGPRYGDVTASGRSATDEEFQAAIAAEVPVLALIQDGDRDGEQQAFVARVRGGWEQGHYAPTFADAGDVGLSVVAALRSHFESQVDQHTRARAHERLLEAAGRADRSVASGSTARLTTVVVGQPQLLDAEDLERPKLDDDLAGRLRSVGLASQAIGLDVTISSAGADIVGDMTQDWEQVRAHVGSEGTLVVEAGVRAPGGLGGMQIYDPKVRELARGGMEFIASVLSSIDTRRLAREIVAVLSVPNSDSKLYVRNSTGNSSRMPMGLPSVVVAEPMVVRREDLTSTSTIDGLVARLRRAFADHDAIE